MTPQVNISLIWARQSSWQLLIGGLLIFMLFSRRPDSNNNRVFDRFDTAFFRLVTKKHLRIKKPTTGGDQLANHDSNVKEIIIT